MGLRSRLEQFAAWLDAVKNRAGPRDIDEDLSLGDVYRDALEEAFGRCPDGHLNCDWRP